MHRILAALIVLIGMTLVANHGKAQSGGFFDYYDAFTGEVFLGGLENVLALRIEGPNLDTAAANALGGFVDRYQTDILEWLFLTPLNGDKINLGSIFPESLSVIELRDEYAGDLLFSDSCTVVDCTNLPPSQPIMFTGSGRAVAKAGGPYTIGLGEDLILDPQGTFLATSPFLTISLALLWDLDLDGEFDDAADLYTNVETGFPEGRIPGGISPELIQPLVIGNAELPERFRTPGTYEIGLRVNGIGSVAFATAIVIVVPEPSSCALLGLGLLTMVLHFRLGTTN